MLKFSDGEKFDLAGSLRITSRKDGLYVVGDGLLIPVDNMEKGRQLIDELSSDEDPKEED